MEETLNKILEKMDSIENILIQIFKVPSIENLTKEKKAMFTAFSESFRNSLEATGGKPLDV